MAGGITLHRSLAALAVVYAWAMGAAAAPTSAEQERPKIIPPLRHPDFSGRLIGVSGGRVDLQLDRSDGQDQLIFQARKLPEVCESETSGAVLQLEARRVDRRGRFEEVSAGGGGQSLDVDFNLVRGRIAGKNASGFVFTMGDLFDPRGSGDNRDECWTDGKVRWRAHRVRHKRAERLRRALTMAGRSDGRAYDGHLTDQRPSTVRLSVDGPRAVFRVRSRIDCDRRDRVLSIDPIEARVDRGGRFESSSFTQDDKTKNRSFVWVRGRVTSRGASGKFAYFEDPWDPNGTPNRQECGTTPIAHWRAQ
jgi:hypothetical protein